MLANIYVGVDIETSVVGAAREQLIVALPGRLSVAHAPHRPGSDDSADCTASATAVSRCRSLVPDKFIRVDWIRVASGSTIRAGVRQGLGGAQHPLSVFPAPVLMPDLSTLIQLSEFC